MSGLEFLKILMPQYPIPVVVVSAVDGIVFEALRVGAVDFVEKPSGGAVNMRTFTEELANKIVIASKATVTNRRPVRQVPAANAGKPPIKCVVGKVANRSGLVAISS